MLESSDVIRDFHHIVEGDTRRFFQFEQQQVCKRRLGAFDLRRKHRLATYMSVQEEIRLGEQQSNTVQPPKCQSGTLKESLAGVGKNQ